MDLLKIDKLKPCRVCGLKLHESKFPKDRGYKSGFSNRCKDCKSDSDRRVYANNSERYKRQRLARRADRAKRLNDIRKGREWKLNNIATLRLCSARKSAEKRGLEFNIDRSDIQIPTHCPLLGIELSMGPANNRDASPSLDRIDSSKGYIKGNVWVISYRANRIKNDATLDELRMIVKNLAKVERDHR